MDIFGIGPLELLLILIIFMVVIGPEKLPDFGRRLGRAVRAFRGATSSLTQELDREVRALEKEVRAVAEQEDVPPASRSNLNAPGDNGRGEGAAGTGI